MSVHDNGVGTVEILAVNEEMLAELYRAYAGVYPEMADFWNHLADDELRHAGWVRALIERVERGELTIREGRFSPEAFNIFMEYLRQRTAEARAVPPSLFGALSVARDLETTMIEGSFHAAMDGDNDRVRQLLIALTESTKSHVAALNKVWLEHRPPRSMAQPG